MRFHNHNALLSPFDPDYDDTFDEEEAYGAYLNAGEEKAEQEREDRYQS